MDLPLPGMPVTIQASVACGTEAGMGCGYHDGADEALRTVEEIAAELRAAGVVDAALSRCEALAGGTASRVSALARADGAPELVIKVNKPALVQAEAMVLRLYARSALLPRLHHEDPAHRFLVIDFVPGGQLRYGVDRVDVGAVLMTLVQELLGRYVPASEAGVPAGVVGELAVWLEDGNGSDENRTDGSGESVSEKWRTFLERQLSYRREVLAPHVTKEDRQLVERLARGEGRVEDGPLYLMHGDCGAHNFLFERRGEGLGALRAAIDPYPVVGYPILDLAYGFVSWPNGLDPAQITPAAEALREAGRWRPNGEWRQVLYEEVAIALYMRMGTCLMHHPRDLPAYLEAWRRWRGMVG